MAAKRTASDAFATPAAWSGLVAGSSSTSNWNLTENEGSAEKTSKVSRNERRLHNEPIQDLSLK